MPQIDSNAHDSELPGASQASAEARLSKTDLRKLRFIERRPWVAPVLIAFFWITFIGSSWYQLAILTENGAEFGLATPSDIWQLADSWQDQKRLFHPYEVLVLEKVSATISQAGMYFVVTCFVLASTYENRLVLKLWHALQHRCRS